MIEIMKSGHPLWNKTISFAEKCSWRAGAALARKMRENDFAENERVLVALENDEIAGFKNKTNDHFTEVMLIRSAADEKEFKETYGVESLKVEY